MSAIKKMKIAVIQTISFLIICNMGFAANSSEIRDMKDEYHNKAENLIDTLKDLDGDEKTPFAYYLSREFFNAAEDEKYDYKTAIKYYKASLNHSNNAIGKVIYRKFIKYKNKFVVQPSTPEGFYNDRKLLENYSNRFFKFTPQYAKYIKPKVAAKTYVLLQKTNEEITENDSTSANKVDQYLDKINHNLNKLERIKPHSVYFETAKHKIADAKMDLDDLYLVLSAMKESPSTQLKIKGHTDSQGPEDYNYKLSVQRAKSIEEWLTYNGISSKRIHSYGYRDSDPESLQSGQWGKQLNRRVEFSSFYK